MRKAFPVSLVVLVLAAVATPTFLWAGLIMKSDAPAAVALATIAPPPRFEFRPDTYRLRWDPEFEYGCTVRYPVHIDDATRARIARTPELASDNARYAALRLDGEGPDGLIVVIFDESGGTGKGFDTAYIDANRNWDLSDDAPSRFMTPEGVSRTRTYLGTVSRSEPRASDWVKVKSRQGPADGWHGGREIQIRLRPVSDSRRSGGVVPLRSYGGTVRVADGLDALVVDKKGAWTGKAVGPNGEVEIALIDVNNDGIYGGKAELRDGFPSTSPGELLLAGAYGLSARKPDQPTGSTVVLNEITSIAGKFYLIRPNCIGNLLAIRQYSGPVGTLSVEASDVAGLTGTANHFELVGDRTGPLSLDGETVVLPAGKYKANSFVLSLSREGSGSTDLNCVFDGGRTVAVECGKPADIEVEGDLTAAIHTDQAKPVCKPGEWIRFDIVPRIGDAVTVRSVGGVTGAPQMDFINKAGKAVLTKTAGRP